jgi:hypothetical protein
VLLNKDATLPASPGQVPGGHYMKRGEDGFKAGHYMKRGRTALADSLRSPCPEGQGYNGRSSTPNGRSSTQKAARIVCCARQASGAEAPLI